MKSRIAKNSGDHEHAVAQGEQTFPIARAFGIGVVSISQFTIAGYALAQFAVAYSLIAQFGVYVHEGHGQLVRSVMDCLALL